MLRSMKTSRTFRLAGDVWKLLTKVARKRRISRTAVVEELARTFLAPAPTAKVWIRTEAIDIDHHVANGDAK